MFGSSNGASSGAQRERAFSLPRLTGRNSPDRQDAVGGTASTSPSNINRPPRQRSSLFNLVMTRVQQGPSGSSRVQNSADDAVPSSSSSSSGRSQPVPSLSRKPVSPVPPPPVVYLTPPKQPSPSTTHSTAHTPACTPDVDVDDDVVDRALAYGPLVARSVTYNDAVAAAAAAVPSPKTAAAHSPSPSAALPQPATPRSVGSQWCTELQCLQRTSSIYEAITCLRRVRALLADIPPRDRMLYCKADFDGACATLRRHRALTADADVVRAVAAVTKQYFSLDYFARLPPDVAREIFVWLPIDEFTPVRSPPYLPHLLFVYAVFDPFL